VSGSFKSTSNADLTTMIKVKNGVRDSSGTVRLSAWVFFIILGARSSFVLAGEAPGQPEYTRGEIRQLCHKLSSNDDRVRWRAAQDLIKAGRRSTDTLCEILQGEWLEGRKLAAYLLGEIKDPTSVLPLASCLGDEDFHVRWKCAVSLKRIGKPSVAALIQVLRTGNLDAGYCAAWALGEIKDPRATLPLAETATVNDHHLRWKSIISLKRIGPPAIEELNKLLKGEQVKARRCAVWALDQLGGEAAAGPLLRATSDADEEVRHRAAEALSKYDRPDVRAALEKLLEDESISVRRQAVMSIARLGKDAAMKRNGGVGDDHVPKWRLYEVVHKPRGETARAQMAVKFLTPSQGSRTVRGFCTPDGTWRARIAPGEAGEWFYRMTFAADGKTTEEHGMFSCDDSDLPGALRVVDEPRPHLEAGGRPFLPVEAPLPEADLTESFAAWRLLIDACRKHGFNLLRLDLQQVFGATDRASAESLIDELLAYGHQRGMYFVLTLFDEGHLRDEDFWKRSRFSAANGGPVPAKDPLPIFYDPLSPQIAAMQEEYIVSVAARAGGYANVIFELCRNFNTDGSAVPFAKGWLRRRLELFDGCGRPVMLSVGEGAESLCAAEGIGIAGVRAGPAPEGRVPAVSTQCPSDPAGAVSAAWLAAVGNGGFASWARTPLATFEDSIRYVTQAEARAQVLAEFGSRPDLYALHPDAGIVLALPPGLKAAAASGTGRVLLYLAGSAAGGELVNVGMVPGGFTVRWLNVRTGRYRRSESAEQAGGAVELACPRFTGGIVAEIQKN